MVNISLNQNKKDIPNQRVTVFLSCHFYLSLNHSRAQLSGLLILMENALYGMALSTVVQVQDDVNSKVL